MGRREGREIARQSRYTGGTAVLLSGIRAHLRLLTTLWLCAQTAALSALAPPVCCAAHGQDGEAAGDAHPAGHHDVDRSPKDCHTAAPTESCPMTDASGVPCPMHDRAPRRVDTTLAERLASGEVTAADAAPTADECVLRGDCRVPSTALASLIWIPGMLDGTVVTHLAGVSDLAVPETLSPLSAAHPVHLPPPRL